MIECVCLECGHRFSRLRRRGSMEVCSPCLNKKRVRDWKRANKERARQHRGYGGDRESKKRYAKSDQGLANGRAKSHRWYWADPERARSAQRTNYARNRDRDIQKVVQRSERIAQSTPSWANLEDIAAVYAEARRLTPETGIRYQVDHIFPLKRKDSCGLHIRANLQLLPAKLNASKGNRLPTLNAGSVILQDAFAGG
jgi:hypothetical protein